MPAPPATGPLVKPVTPSGNGAHAGVPKELIGREMVMVPKDELVCISWARGKPRPPAVMVDGSSFVASALNRHGEQMILVSPRRDPQPTLYHQDADWVPLDLMNAGGDLIAKRRDTKEEIRLDPTEVTWLLSCLPLLGLPGIEGLPQSKVGESWADQFGRALAYGDRKRQIVVLEKLLAQLKTKA